MTIINVQPDPKAMPSHGQILDFWTTMDNYLHSIKNDKLLFYLPVVIETETYNITRKNKAIFWVRSEEEAQLLIKQLTALSDGRGKFKIKIEHCWDDVTFSVTAAVQSQQRTAAQFIAVMQADIDICNEDLEDIPLTDETEEWIEKLQKKIAEAQEIIEKVTEWSNRTGKTNIVIRQRTGNSYGLSFYDPTIGKRKQIHLGDFLIFISAQKPSLLLPKQRKRRTDQVNDSREFICESGYGDVFEAKNEVKKSN